MTLVCDFRISTDHTEFALPEVSLGIIPGSGGTQRLPRLIGLTRAKELILTARRIDASMALEMGIISKVISKDELLEEARTLAKEIAKNSPLAIAYAKAAVNLAMETSLEQGLRFETAAIRTTLAHEDYKIGLAAFAERRSPNFPTPNSPPGNVRGPFIDHKSHLILETRSDGVVAKMPITPRHPKNQKKREIL